VPRVAECTALTHLGTIPLGGLGRRWRRLLLPDLLTFLDALLRCCLLCAPGAVPQGRRQPGLQRPATGPGRRYISTGRRDFSTGCRDICTGCREVSTACQDISTHRRLRRSKGRGGYSDLAPMLAVARTSSLPTSCAFGALLSMDHGSICAAFVYLSLLVGLHANPLSP
jgi:hypothetical protein